MSVKSNMFLVVGAFLLPCTTNAIIGPTVVGDCNQQLILSSDDFSTLSYQPGEMPEAQESSCRFQNVGTTFAEPVDPLDTEYLIQDCSGSLIHIDDKKAVFLYSAHCSHVQKPKWVTFEPQPSIPFSAVQDGGQPNAARLKTLMTNLIPIKGEIISPNWAAPSDFTHDVSMLIIDNTDQKVSNLGITPLTVPPEPGYLSRFNIDVLLNNTSWTAAGYSRLGTLYTSDPTVNPGTGFTTIIAQHNRTYGNLVFRSHYEENQGGIFPGMIYMHGQLTADRNTICSGDSGSPLIINGNMVVGVGTGGGYIGSGCNLVAIYTPIDTYDNLTFIRCAIDPEKSADEALGCSPNVRIVD